MKNLTFFMVMCSLLLLSSGYSQTYNMTSGTVNTCSGTFYDNGGLGLYLNNSNVTQTFCGNTPGTTIRASFTTFQVDALDQLMIYDGPTTFSPLIGVYTGSSLTGISLTGTTGCLTFRFVSNGFTALNGWSATLSCAFACQPFTPIADSLSVMPDTSVDKIVRLCIGDALFMSGSANYSNNGTFYNQSDATSTFKWRTGDGFTYTTKNVNHVFTIPGIFDIHLEVTDTNGCVALTKIARALISIPPTFKNAKIFPSDSICLGDTAILTISDSGLFIPFQPPALNNAGVTFLPDGSGVSYSDVIPVSIFAPTATFGTGYLKGIYVNMEHSYLGDLEITISCPNGQVARLKEYPGGGGTFLGEPIDQGFGATSVPGIGYTYEFTNFSPTYGTMVAENANHQQTFTDLAGTTYTNVNYLPAGTYTPFQNLSTQLAGCPLNGNWTITITDNLGSDDGYIFFWGLNFDTTIRPPASTSQVILGVRDSSIWTSTSPIINVLGDTSTLTSPTVPGIHQYTYQIYDNFGCTHDTTLSLYVRPKPVSNAGADSSTCLLSNQLQGVTMPRSTANTWSWYSDNPTGSSAINNTNIYNPTTVVNEYGTYYYILEETVDGCQTTPDTVEIEYIEVVNTISVLIENDTLCLPENAVFVNTSDMTEFDSILWSFGDGRSSRNQGSVTHDYENPGCYDLTVTLVNSLGCTVDSVLTNIVCAFPSPFADFSSNPFEPIVPQTLINFTNLSSGATSYVWEVAGLDTSNLTDYSYEFPKVDGGSYLVTLTATNEGGCVDDITKTIEIKNPLNYFIPSAFTPNDDGLNDEFKVVFNNNLITEYSFIIFNRWGEVIFFSLDPDEAWDGKFEGELVPEGIYVYKIKGKEKQQLDGFEKFGQVSVLRL